MKKLLLKLIKQYQHNGFWRKPLFKALFLTDASCRFIPTCSQYCYQAIAKYGIIKGLFLGLRRISKCHPWNKGGVDPVR